MSPAEHRAPGRSTTCVRCRRELEAGTAAILCRPCVGELLERGLSDSVMAELYRAVHEASEQVTNADIDWTLSDVFPRWLERHVPRSARIVEFGGGGGFHAQAVVERGFSDVLVTDVDSGAVAACTARFPGLRAEVMDANALTLPTASVDVAISIEVVEHLLAPDRHVAEVARVLRPGGHFLVRTPNRLAADVYYRWAGRYDMPIWHPSTFSHGGLVRLLVRHGFRCEDLPMEELPESQVEKLPRPLRFLARLPMRWIPPSLRPSIVLVATRGGS